MRRPRPFKPKNQRIRDGFLAPARTHPQRLKPRRNLSGGNWGFGAESLASPAARLSAAPLRFIELHISHCSPDLGYRPYRRSV